MDQQSKHLEKATSYKRIKAYSKNLKDYIKEKGIPFELEKFPYEIKMDFDTEGGKGLGRLKKDLHSQRLLCVLGLGPNEKGEMEFKVSFLGLDDKDQVDPRHKPKDEKMDPVDGEETWPPGDQITNPTIDLP
jgi:hypothetical protein